MNALVYRRSKYSDLPQVVGTKTVEPRRAPLPALPIFLRSMMPSDVNFIRDTWAQSYRRCGVDSECRTEPSHYKVEMRARMARLMDRSTIIVACDPEDRNLIRGYVVYEKPQADEQLPVLHYVLVTPPCQNRGLGRKLIELVRESAYLPDSLVYGSHWTTAMRSIGKRYGILQNNFCLEVG